MYSKKLVTAMLSGIVAASMFAASAGALTVNAEEAQDKKIYLIYVDENGNKVGQNTVLFSHIDKDGNGAINSTEIPMPIGCVYGEETVGDVFAYADEEIQTIKVKTSKEVGVNYWDVDKNEQAGEGTVKADAYNVNTSQLTDIPEGYELVNLGDIQINDGWIFVEVREASEKAVKVNYWDVDKNEQAGEGTVTVKADDKAEAANVSTANTRNS